MPRILTVISRAIAGAIFKQIPGDIIKEICEENTGGIL